MNVLFLSPHFPPNFWHFCRGLREAGATALGIGDAPYESLRPDLRAALHDYYWVPDMHRHEDVVRGMGWLTWRHGKIDRLDSMSEYWLEAEARLRDDFNVLGLRTADMPRIKRKSEMKRCFREAGIPVARGRVCQTGEALRALVADVGYPVVAKPDVGVGAAQTFKISGDRELEAYLAAKPPVDYIVEEFIDAPIVTYDGLTDAAGRVVFDASLAYCRGIMETVNEDSDVWYQVARDVPADLAEAGRMLVDAFGVRERFFHFEFFRHPGGRLVALEVNVRPPGGLTVDMWNWQNDVDLYREWGNLLVTGRIGCRPSRAHYVAWISRKDRFRYRASRDEISARLGPALVHQERVEGIFTRALGDEGFVVRSPHQEAIHEAVALIQEKLP
jgi:hypothetical protein